MNGFARFVSRRLAAFAGFVLALAAVNLLIFGLFMSFFVLPAYGENSPARLLNQVAEASTATGLPPELVLELRQRSVWAMLLDDAGGLQWGEGLPAELPQRYTVGQVAQFSRGYLADHPVFVQNTQNGLLVLGYPKNSYTKLTSNYYPLGTVRALPWLAGLLLALDLLALFLAYFCSRHRVLRYTAPLVDSIQALAQGEPVALQEKGELAPVAHGLNQAAGVLARQNEARAGWIRGVSHDIRTPLSMILGYADRIAQSEQTPP